MTNDLNLRRWRRMSLVLAAMVCLSALPVLAAPATAQETQAGESQAAQSRGTQVLLRAYVLGDHFSFSEASFGVDTSSTVSYRGRPGGGLDIELLPVATIGIDLAASQTHIAADQQTFVLNLPPMRRTGNIQMRTFTLGLFAHPFEWRRADLYIGPVVGAVQRSGGFRSGDTRFGFGGAGGLELPLGSSGLAVSAVVRLVASRFADQLRDVSHYRTQTLYGAGLSYRW